jgi:hypothetical protein
MDGGYEQDMYSPGGLQSMDGFYLRLNRYIGRSLARDRTPAWAVPYTLLWLAWATVWAVARRGATVVGPWLFCAFVLAVLVGVLGAWLGAVAAR